MLHVCPPDREQRNPKPTSFLSADSAGEALSFARCLLFSMEHCEWQVPWRELKGKQRKERREKRILGKQDERLGQVPGCHLAKYVGQPSFAYKSASNLQISVAGSQQNCQSPGTAIFWSPFPWWSFPSSTQPSSWGAVTASCSAKSCLSPEDHRRRVPEPCRFPIFGKVSPASKKLNVYCCF